MDLFNLFAKIALDTSDYEKGLYDSEKKASSFGEKLKGGLKTAGKIGAAAVGAVAAGTAALGTALVKGAGEVAAYGDNIDKMSQKLGISAEAYQEWDAILQHSGTSIDSLQKGLMSIGTAMGELQNASNVTIDTTEIEKSRIAYERAASAVSDAEKEYNKIVKKRGADSKAAKDAYNNLVEAQIKATEAEEKYNAALEGTSPEIGAAAKAIAALGVETKTSSGEMRNQEDVFSDIITALQKTEDESQRNALAQDIFGQSVKELGPLLNTSAEDTEAMRQRVHELGGVMSDEAVKAAASYQDALQDMQTAFGGLKNKLFSEFMPGITSVMGGITEIFSGDSDSGVGQVSAGISDIISRISTGMPKILQVGGQIVKGLAKAIMSNLPLLMSEGAKIIVQLATGIVQNLPELIKTGLEIIVELANSIAEAIPELIPTIVEVVMTIADILTNPDTIVVLLNAAVQIIMALANGLIQALPELISRAPQIVSNLVDAIIAATPLLFKAGAELIKKLLQGATKVYTSLVTAGRQIIDKLKEGLSTAFNALRDWVGEKFDTLKEKMTVPVEKARDAIKGIIDKIKGFFDFTAKTPKIKLPHFKIEPEGWTFGDLFHGIKPTLSIEWYKKAYDNPYLFTSPTVVGNRGFGDGQGGEIVYGHENLMDDIRAASANDERIDTIIALLREIVENGLTANIGKNQLYKTMANMNRSRNYATGYNGFSGV